MAKRKPVKIGGTLQPEFVAKRIGLSKASYSDLVRAVGKVQVRNSKTGQFLSFEDAVSSVRGTALAVPIGKKTSKKSSKAKAFRSHSGSKMTNKHSKVASSRIGKLSRK